MSVIFIKFSNNEEYIKINENNKEVSIKLKNHKEYYGHKFYRFSSFKSETEVIKELRSNHYNAYYDKRLGKLELLTIMIFLKFRWRKKRIYCL